MFETKKFRTPITSAFVHFLFSNQEKGERGGGSGPGLFGPRFVPNRYNVPKPCLDGHFP